MGLLIISPCGESDQYSWIRLPNQPQNAGGHGVSVLIIPPSPPPHSARGTSSPASHDATGVHDPA